MDNLSNSFLKYGDEVLFYSEQMSGYFFSEGWFDETLYSAMAIDNRDGADKLKHPSFSLALNRFTFIVNPKLSYDAKKQLVRFESNTGKNEDPDFAKNKEILEKRCKQEVYYNNRTKKTKYGEFVVYGSEIELVHKASGKILTIVKNSSVLETKFGAFLELKDSGHPEKCDFKILPRYKFRSEGENIIYGDYFVLFNENTKSYVYISPNLINKVEMYVDPPSYRPKVMFRREPSSSLFSKNVMEMKPRTSSRLQLIPFKHFEQDVYRFI